MPIGIVSRALLRIGKNAVGLGRFLELLFGRVVARVAVRMVLHGKLAVGSFQFLIPGATSDAEHLIIIAFCHRHSFEISWLGRIRPTATRTMDGPQHFAFEMIAALKLAHNRRLRRRLCVSTRSTA